MRLLYTSGRVLTMTFIVAFAAGCHDSAERLVSIDFSGPAPDPAEWNVVSPAAAGMNEQVIAGMWADLDASSTQHGFHSLLIVRHGMLVGEKYWDGQHSGMGHDLRSATKSITSLLTGIAIDRGALSGVSEPVFRRLAASYTLPANPDPRKETIAVAHLLQMSSGLACDDWTPSSAGNEENMYPTRDWTRFFLDLPVVADAGKSTYYCTAGVVALGRVVSEATSRPIADFARDVLFTPLGISQYKWSTFDDGRQTDTGGHLYLRSRDMAKIGQLVLQRGQWQGRQIVSADWIDRSTSEQVMLPGSQPYGYLWWLHTAWYRDHVVRYIAAQGNGGQMIMIVPELDLVVVATGGNFNTSRTNSPLRLLENRIVPAVER